MQSESSLRAELERKLREQEALRKHLLVQHSLMNPFFWLTEATKTKDEQHEKRKLPAFRPFPKSLYIKHLIDVFDKETRPVVYVRKSRTMMGTWTMAGWTAWKIFTRPATTAVVMSLDWPRALKTVEYVKTLWDQSSPELKKRWPTLGDRPPFEQAAEHFQLASGSWIKAIPHDPGRVRSEHSTIVLMDEAAHIPRGEENFNVALHSRPMRLIALSSMATGWFHDKTADAVAVDWPEYDEWEKTEAA